MPRPERREKKLIMEAGRIYLNDETMSVSKRVQALQQFIHEFQQEKERLSMVHFKETNGFEATDDNAKRSLVDKLYRKICGSHPKDDAERNACIPASYGSIMKIGWTPNY